MFSMRFRASERNTPSWNGTHDLLSSVKSTPRYLSRSKYLMLLFLIKRKASTRAALSSDTNMTTGFVRSSDLPIMKSDKSTKLAESCSLSLLSKWVTRVKVNEE